MAPLRKALPGDKVVMAEVPIGLLHGLPIEDQQAIFEIVGKPVRLNEYDADGRAEVEFTDSEGVLHYIYVSPDAIKLFQVQGQGGTCDPGQSLTP